jgi:hypothetical protein
LEFDAAPFLDALEKLRAKQYGRQMEKYKPPSDGLYDKLFSDEAIPKPSEEDVRLRIIHSQWVDLHPITRQNLLKFETPGFKLPKMASGEQEVKNLVSYDVASSNLLILLPSLVN